MQNKKILQFGGCLAVLAVVFLLGVSVGRDYQVPNAPVTQGQFQSTASLRIDYGNGQVKSYENLSGRTVFEVLKQASEKNGVDLKYKDYGDEMGIFIESIGNVGTDPDGKKWWQYWVNNEYSRVGAGVYSIQSGDVIEFKFIESQE